MQRMIIITGCMVASLWGNAKPEHNVINEVFHHQGALSRERIELGKVVFYMRDMPNIVVTDSVMTTHDSSLERVVLVLPEMKVPKKWLEYNAELRDGDAIVYRVSLRKDRTSLHIVIQYNMQLVTLDYALFESISQQKGLEIRFYNKPVLDTLHAKGHSQLRVACNDQSPLVVIDAGHGGHDYGAVGHNGIYEKDVTLAISQDVAFFLQKRGIATYVTRNSDVYVPLDERTSKANQTNARCFVSIHANASVRPQVSGLETYCLSPMLFSPLPGGSSKHACSGCVAVVVKEHCNQSLRLAEAVHNSVMQSAQHARTDILTDRHIKHSVGQVLLGAAMPCVLVEVGFLSNPCEAGYLASNEYRSALARGIGEGIIAAL